MIGINGVIYLIAVNFAGRLTQKQNDQRLLEAVPMPFDTLPVGTHNDS